MPGDPPSKNSLVRRTSSTSSSTCISINSLLDSGRLRGTNIVVVPAPVTLSRLRDSANVRHTMVPLKKQVESKEIDTSAGTNRPAWKNFSDSVVLMESEKKDERITTWDEMTDENIDFSADFLEFGDEKVRIDVNSAEKDSSEKERSVESKKAAEPAVWKIRADSNKVLAKNEQKSAGKEILTRPGEKEPWKALTKEPEKDAEKPKEREGSRFAEREFKKFLDRDISKSAEKKRKPGNFLENKRDLVEDRRNSVEMKKSIVENRRDSFDMKKDKRRDSFGKRQDLGEVAKEMTLSRKNSLDKRRDSYDRRSDFSDKRRDSGEKKQEPFERRKDSFEKKTESFDKKPDPFEKRPDPFEKRKDSFDRRRDSADLKKDIMGKRQNSVELKKPLTDKRPENSEVNEDIIQAARQRQFDDEYDKRPVVVNKQEWKGIPEVEEQQREVMLQAKERARKRREEEERKEEERKKRAAEKLRELETKMGIRKEPQIVLDTSKPIQILKKDQDKRVQNAEEATLRIEAALAINKQMQMQAKAAEEEPLGAKQPKVVTKVLENDDSPFAFSFGVKLRGNGTSFVSRGRYDPKNKQAQEYEENGEWKQIAEEHPEWFS